MSNLKKTLSKAAGKVGGTVGDFLGISMSQQLHDNADLSKQEDNPYWMQDSFWEGHELHSLSPSAPPLDVPISSVKSPSNNEQEESDEELPPPYIPPDDELPPYVPPVSPGIDSKEDHIVHHESQHHKSQDHIIRGLFLKKF